jgi:hypothetical protein
MIFNLTIVRLLFIISFIFLLSPLYSFAQEQQVPELDSDSNINQDNIENYVVVADINLSNAHIISQQEDIVTVGFTLDNLGDIPQFDIRYGVGLVKILPDETQIPVDTLVSPEYLVINESEGVAVVMEYSTKNIPPGTYTLWAVSNTSSGLPLGIGVAGEVVVEGEEQMLEVIPDTCHVLLGTDNKKYSIKEDINLAGANEMSLSCVFVNHTDSTSTFTPKITTYQHSVYGEQVNINQSSTEPLSIEPNETEDITFTITNPLEAGAYVSVVSLSDTEDEIISNKIILNYSVDGSIAVIQNINLDKFSYGEGETLSIRMYWTGGDRGPVPLDSEPSTVEAEDRFSAEILVAGDGGVECIDATYHDLITSVQDLTAVVHTACVNAIATVTIIDNEGIRLDTTTISSPEMLSETFFNNGVDTTESKNYNTMYIVIVFASLVFLGIFVYFVSRNRKHIPPIDNSIKMLLIFTVAVVGVLAGDVEEVEAVTWNSCTYAGGCADPDFTYVTSFNKSVYAPSEKVIANTLITKRRGVMFNIRLRVLANGTDENYTVFSPGSVSNMTHNRRLLSPSTSGAFDMRIRSADGRRLGAWSPVSQVFYRGLSVGPIAQPAVGNFDGTDSSACRVGGWAYDPDSSGRSISVHVYKDGPAGTGTFIASCSANQPRRDVNTAFGVAGNHGFNCALPASMKGVGSKNIYIHAIDVSGTPNNVISSSPKNINCPAAIVRPTCSLSPSASSVVRGSGLTLRWTTSNATRAFIRNVGAVTPVRAGSRIMRPIIDTTYIMTVVGPGGSSTCSSRNVSVTASPPPPPPPGGSPPPSPASPTLTFTSSPASVPNGGSSTLTWSTTNVTTCTASNAWSGARMINSSEVTGGLFSTKTYTLSCTGPGGSIIRNVTVNVSAPPPAPSCGTGGSGGTINGPTPSVTSCVSWGVTCVAWDTFGVCTATGPVCTGTATTRIDSFQANPARIFAGETSTLTGSGSGDRVSCTAGTQVVSPITVGPHTYTFTCSGPGGNVSSNVIVTVVPPPAISLNFVSRVLRTGEATNFTATIGANYPTTCAVSGVEISPYTINHSGCPTATKNYFTSTKSYTASQVIEVECKPNSTTSPIGESFKEDRVRVVGNIEET